MKDRSPLTTKGDAGRLSIPVITNRTNRRIRNVVESSAPGTLTVPIALVLVMAIHISLSPDLRAAPSYSFKAVKTLGDNAPAGGTFVNDFEPGGLNNFGDMAFGADVSTGGEGVFVRHRDQIIELARTGGAAPAGVTFEFGFLGTITLNGPGDASFTLLLQPFTAPFGVNAGVYRYSHYSQTVTP